MKPGFLKSILCLLLLQFIALPAFAEDVVTYSGSTYTGCQTIGNTNIFLNDPNDYQTVKDGFLYIESGCQSLPQGPKKVVGGQVVSKTAQEIADDEAAELAAQTLAVRTGAKANLDGFSENPLLLRAIADTINDRENNIAGRVNDIIACYVNNSTASNIRNCVIALNNLPATVTLAQARDIIKGKIDNGSVDS